MKKKRLMLLVVLCLGMLMVFAACSDRPNTGGDETDEPTTVVFGDAGWDSMRFHNAVAILIGEAAYNIEGKETSGTTAITYTGLLNGDVDVYMETWTDNLATYNDDIAAGKIKEISVNFDDNIQGLYVPRYVIEGDAERGIEASAPDLKKVEDLKNYSDVFVDPDDTSKGRIYGAISGWEVDTIMRNKFTYYGLDANYNYMDPGSDAALAAAIASAYEKGKPIVAYYWEPTWVTGKYDLVLLEDAPYDEAIYHEGKCACPAVRVTICVNPDFYESNSEFCEFLSNYQTSSAMTAEALSYIQDNEATYDDAAKWFLGQHDELLSQWLPDDKAELVREALNG